MMLEAMCCDINDTIDLPITENDIHLIDWEPLVTMLLNNDLLRCQRAAIFHNSLANNIVQQALMYRDNFGEFAIGLSGGVFQNKRLSESAMSQLRAQGFRVYYPQQHPVNDAGLAFGQIIETLAHDD